MTPRRPRVTEPRKGVDLDQQIALEKPGMPPPPHVGNTSTVMPSGYTQFNLPEGMTEADALQIVSSELLTLLVRCRDVIYQLSPQESPLIKDINATLAKYGRS